MIFEETELKGAYLIKPKKLEDKRGFFSRAFCQMEFLQHGLDTSIVQCNTSFNKEKGTFRGMHFQVYPFEENKIVRCAQGAVWDVIADIRTDSPTFGKWTAVELNDDNQYMLYIPARFAHGFLTLKDHSTLFYMMTAYHSPANARGFRWNDASFDIRLPGKVKCISERDSTYPDFDPSVLEPGYPGFDLILNPENPNRYEYGIL